MSWPAVQLLYPQRLSWKESVSTNHTKTWVSYFCSHFPARSRMQKVPLRESPTANILYWIHTPRDQTQSPVPSRHRFLSIAGYDAHKSLLITRARVSGLLSYVHCLVSTTHVTAHTPPQLRTEAKFSSSSSSSSSSICHGVGPLVDPFRSHVPRSLFKGLQWFLIPVGE